MLSTFTVNLTRLHVEPIFKSKLIFTNYLYLLMFRFKNKETMLLVVTDVAARGVDIPLLDNAINVHFPEKPKLFVHRVGEFFGNLKISISTIYRQSCSRWKTGVGVQFCFIRRVGLLG